MIKYDFGIECEISWDKFLCVDMEGKRLYKQDFTDFSNLFYFIEHNKKHITHLLFDGYEYITENGLLHNLYGPAKLRHTEKNEQQFFGNSRWYFINGKLVSDEVGSIRGCKTEKSFEEGEIFFYEELTNKQSGRDNTGKMYRRKEGVDYIKHHIDLKKLREKDIRKKKLKKIEKST